MLRLALGGLLLISGLSSPGGAAAADPAPAATHAGAIDEGAELVFLLQYVGSDYALAVNGGRIVDEAEYAENREFARLIVEKLERLKVRIPPSKLGPIADAVGKLDALVGSLGEPQLVRELSEAAIPRLIDALDLRSFPRERPDPERARALYAENCATCHGAHGAGDGPRARDLDPPPTRFTDRARMTMTAPYVFYNAIMLGVANTAMASFDYLPDQDRWALAFYLWTFVADEAKAAPPPIALSQRDLATRSSADLAPEVVRQAATGGRTINPEEAMRWIGRASCRERVSFLV